MPRYTIVVTDELNKMLQKRQGELAKLGQRHKWSPLICRLLEEHLLEKEK